MPKPDSNRNSGFAPVDDPAIVWCHEQHWQLKTDADVKWANERWAHRLGATRVSAAFRLNDMCWFRPAN